MRLSYHQRIAEVVPEQFDPFVPPKPLAVYKYSNDIDLPEAGAASQLESCIRSKGTTQVSGRDRSMILQRTK